MARKKQSSCAGREFFQGFTVIKNEQGRMDLSMKTVFYGSSNSRYFLAERGNKLTMYHEDRVLWETEITHGDFSVVGVGNSGCLVLKTNEEIYLFRPGERPAGESIKKLQAAAFQKMSSEIKEMYLNDEGSQLCILKSSAKSKVSEKIFGALASVKVEKGLKEFELLVYDILSGNFQSLYRVVHPVSMEQHFKWAISRDFNFFLVGNPRKTPSGTGVKYSIIDTTNLKIARSFELEETEVARAMISNDGTSLLQASKKGQSSIIIVTRDAYSFSILPPEGARILHLGKGFVCFYEESPPVIVAKAFDNKDLCKVSLAPLEDRKVEYGALFNLRDHVTLLYFKDDQLSVHHSELSTLEVEIKRFELSMSAPATFVGPVQPEEERVPPSVSSPAARVLGIERAREIEPEPSIEPPARQPARTLSLDLPGKPDSFAAMTMSDESAAVEPGTGVSWPAMEKLPGKVELYQSLETLKLRLVMGAISEEEYKEKKEKIEKFIQRLEDKLAASPVPLPAYKTNVLKPHDDKDKKESAEEEAQRLKIQQLLESLEERFILGEVNEASYRELKAKYLRSLAAIRYQASPSQISKDTYHFGE